MKSRLALAALVVVAAAGTAGAQVQQPTTGAGSTTMQDSTAMKHGTKKHAAKSHTAKKHGAKKAMAGDSATMTKSPS